MSIFSGLGAVGLDSFKEKSIFEEEKATVAKDELSGLQIMEEKDFLFEKSYTCPVCDSKFKVPAIRAGKAKLIGQDADLRPRYEGIDPIKYDAILCNNCGFAAISRGFTNMTTLQMRNIKEKVCSNFRPLPESGETYSYDDAIIRHKIALICSVVKNAKASERAYTCLKISWLLKSKLEIMDNKKSAEYKELEQQLKESVQNAYDGFQQAFSKESFPICGMEEMAYTYLVAELARDLGKYEEATRLIGRIIINPNANQRIKEKAIDLKERIKEDLVKDLAAEQK